MERTEMKAILVIDMPKSCDECPLVVNDECMKERKNNKPKACPLRPMPQKRENNEEWLNEYHRDDYADGYNRCIDEIMGEEE